MSKRTRVARTAPGSQDVPASVAVIAAVVLLLLVGLPLAVWLDLRNLSDHSLRRQAEALESAIDHMRQFYTHNVVGRVLGSTGPTPVVHNYLDIPGAIPLPATLSLELGTLITGTEGNVRYRFFSDYPFANRAPHVFDAFEQQALTRLRQNPQSPVYEISGSIFDRRIRLATPVIMAGECVTCHNTHPESPKRDWKIAHSPGFSGNVLSHS